MLKSAPGPLKLVPLKGSFPRVPLSKPDHLVLHPGAWVSSFRFNPLQFTRFCALCAVPLQKLRIISGTGGSDGPSPVRRREFSATTEEAESRLLSEALALQDPSIPADQRQTRSHQRDPTPWGDRDDPPIQPPPPILSPAQERRLDDLMEADSATEAVASASWASPQLPAPGRATLE